MWHLQQGKPHEKQSSVETEFSFVAVPVYSVGKKATVRRKLVRCISSEKKHGTERRDERRKKSEWRWQTASGLVAGKRIGVTWPVAAGSSVAGEEEPLRERSRRWPVTLQKESPLSLTRLLSLHQYCIRKLILCNSCLPINQIYRG